MKYHICLDCSNRATWKLKNSYVVGWYVCDVCGMSALTYKCYRVLDESGFKRLELLCAMEDVERVINKYGLEWDLCAWHMLKERLNEN